MESFRHVLLATMELWDRSSKLLQALFLKLRAKTIVFALMDTLFVDTRRSWCMLSSELRSFHSLWRFPSVSREYAAVVLCASVTQQYPYIGSCIDVRRTCTRSFSIVSFTQLKKKCLQKLTSLVVDEMYYYSYFIHGCGHSHTLIIATSSARTCNESVISRRNLGEHKLL